MFLATDHMRHVRVRALSPDKTVTATKTAERGIRVNLEFGCLGRHDATSLARQVRAAVSGVLEAYRKAGDEVMKRHFEKDALSDAWQTETGRKLRPFLDALERLTVTGVGPRGVAKVGLDDGRVRVAFRSEALTMREAEVGEEIDAALAAMYDRRSMEAARLYDELVVNEQTEGE